jgi:hypothetical protein
VADSAVFAWLGVAVVDVGLASYPSEANGTGAFERVDVVEACSAVEARSSGALVDVNLALGSGESLTGKSRM